MKFIKLYPLTFIVGFSLFLAGCLPTNQPPQSSVSPKTSEQELKKEAIETSGKTDQELIKEAFQEKHPDWDLSQMDFLIQENTGMFANGSVGPKGGGPGGGMFFAAKTDSGWEIAWDGNGIIECADIEPYSFPNTLIPSCYDSLTQETVTR